MKYTIRFGACGHEATISMIGKVSERERKIAYLEECGLCPECYRAMMKEREAKAEQTKYADADAALEFYGFSELQGTEKQIKYANRLRREKIGNELVGLRTGDTFVENKDEEETVMNWIKWMADIDQAKWWIENDAMQLGEMYEEYKKTAKVEAKMETVYPDDVDANNVCTIVSEGKDISLVSDKDGRIVEVCRELKWKWDGFKWGLNVTSRMGSVDDRIAEMAHKLLLAGFPVRIDKQLVEKATNGDYEHVNPRWIVAGADGNVLLYLERNSDIYSNARELSSSVWDKERGAIRISARYYEEIMDFAYMHGVSISDNALQVLENEKEKFEATSRTTIAGTVNRIQQKDGLVDVLNSSRDVLEDLKDED